MSEVFLCATGQLTQTAKRDLRRAGVVVVEVEDPTRCQFIRSTEVVSADDMLWATLDALSTNDYGGAKEQREQLAKNLLQIVMAARQGGGAS